MASRKKTTPAKPVEPEPLVVHMLPAFAQHAMGVLQAARDRAKVAGLKNDAEVLEMTADAIREAVIARVPFRNHAQDRTRRPRAHTPRP